jgi:hypothetical protein
VLQRPFANWEIREEQIMRTLTDLLVTVGLLLTLSTSAGAVVSVGLVQVGGTYNASLGAAPGDTLVLNVTYGLQPGDFVTIVDPAIVFDGSVSSFNIPGSTETGFAAWSGGAVALNPVTPPGFVLVTPTQADGWEKGTILAGGATVPCVAGDCTSLGTAAFVLSGSAGTISIGAVGLPFGTVIGDGTFMDIAGNPALVSLGTFPIIPEPTTASLLGLGLLGLAAAGRRRKS